MAIRAVLDACVLYPAPLRDLLLHLSCEGLFHARWTDEIHDEWIRNLLLNRPDLKPEQLQRTRELMNRAVPDCVITGYHKLISSLSLPDPHDRHVLAAAIRGKAEVIVTFNKKDFPVGVLAEFGIRVQNPDQFICDLISQDGTAVCHALHAQRTLLKKPPITIKELLSTLERTGLPLTVSQLRQLI